MHLNMYIHYIHVLSKHCVNPLKGFQCRDLYMDIPFSDISNTCVKGQIFQRIFQQLLTRIVITCIFIYNLFSGGTWGSLQHTIILSKRRYVVLLVMTMVINVDFIVEYCMYTDSTNVDFILKQAS